MYEQVQTTYGIIGNPVTHSLSPVMQNAAFGALEVEAVYKKFPLQEDEIAPFFEDLKEKDNPIFGLNVTVPYKQKVMPYCDSLHPFAEKVGAVNTLVIGNDRKIKGFNTDGPGFLAHVAEIYDKHADDEHIEAGIESKRIAILGAGGSARAIIAALCLMNPRPESIRIYNRTPSRIVDLLKDLSDRMDVSIVEQSDTIDDLNIELSDILINTTSVGMKPSDPLLVDEDMLHSNLLVYDLIYAPAETKLLKAAKARGAKAANGLGMLFYQGVLALQHWADMPIDDDIKGVMRQSLQDALNERT